MNKEAFEADIKNLSGEKLTQYLGKLQNILGLATLDEVYKKFGVVKAKSVEEVKPVEVKIEKPKEPLIFNRK